MSKKLLVILFAVTAFTAAASCANATSVLVTSTLIPGFTSSNNVVCIYTNDTVHTNTNFAAAAKNTVGNAIYGITNAYQGIYVNKTDTTAAQGTALAAGGITPGVPNSASDPGTVGTGWASQ